MYLQNFDLKHNFSELITRDYAFNLSKSFLVTERNEIVISFKLEKETPDLTEILQDIYNRMWSFT